jgi:hypothetical protein
MTQILKIRNGTPAALGKGLFTVQIHTVLLHDVISRNNLKLYKKLKYQCKQFFHNFSEVLSFIS